MDAIEIKYHELRAKGIHFGSAEGHMNTFPDKGSKQVFELLTIYHAPETESAFEVSGFILSKYRTMGEQQSELGYPIGDAEKDPEVKKGIKQLFEKGWIGWSPAKGIYYCIENTPLERNVENIDILSKYPKETAFFRKYYDYAVPIEREFRVPALFTVAQSALETGWGKKAPANNMF